MSNLTPEIVPQAMTMSFADAIKAIQTGKRVTRIAWANDDYCYLDEKDDYLSIFTKGSNHTWMINSGDLEGEDWIIVTEPN